MFLKGDERAGTSDGRYSRDHPPPSICDKQRKDRRRGWDLPDRLRDFDRDHKYHIDRGDRTAPVFGIGSGLIDHKAPKGALFAPIYTFSCSRLESACSEQVRTAVREGKSAGRAV